MGPLKNYKLPDGTTRQYREGEQPKDAVLADAKAEQPKAEAPAKAVARKTARKAAPKAEAE